MLDFPIFETLFLWYQTFTTLLLFVIASSDMGMKLEERSMNSS